ncbi:MAG: lactate utilization protein [Chloroflexi bacterium]|nr:lactate utilization protein [Chloroflexota bacterium]
MPEIPESIGLTLKHLRRNGFDARFARTADEASAIMLKMIPAGARVGVGDSTTLRQTGILDELRRRGDEVVNPFVPELTQDFGDPEARRRLFRETSRRTMNTDVFLAGVNAVTGDGRLVSIDYAGNRVAGMIFGAPRVILAAGRNKIVKDVEEAIWRIKNVIAPAHTRRRGRKTPCATTGKCNDCRTPARICNVTVILERRPAETDLTVVLIDEDLGLGWDPSWDNGRIARIESAYYDNSWVFSFPKRP